jgi:hypothetical protein
MARIVITFERGLKWERGRCPLSSEFPFPAINACDFLPAMLAGEGIKGRGYYTNQNQTEPTIG